MYLSLPMAKELRIQPGQMVHAQVMASKENQVLLMVNQQLVAAQAQRPLLIGPATLQVIGADEQQLVMRVVNGQPDDAVDELIRSLGLTVSPGRRCLTRELLARGQEIRRDLMLRLETLMPSDDSQPREAGLLAHLAEARLPLNETTAMAIAHWEQSGPGQQPYYYLYIDLTASPPPWSWHAVDPDGRPRGQTPTPNDRPIVLGCQTENLGPVVVILQSRSPDLDLRMVVMDSRQQDFVSQELPELRRRLIPLVRHVQLAVQTMARGDHPVAPAASLKHLNRRV